MVIFFLNNVVLNKLTRNVLHCRSGGLENSLHGGNAKQKYDDGINEKVLERTRPQTKANSELQLKPHVKPALAAMLCVRAFGRILLIENLFTNY